MPSPVSPDTALLEEAANWAMAFRYGTPTESERQAFDRWRRQSLSHDAAWARAEAVFHAFDQVPAGAGREALHSLGHGSGRRRSLRLLGALLVAAPAGWLAWRQSPWREWTADVATATGERRTLALPDGSRLVLNTASAVDIFFSAAERRIRLLAGEILVTTHADPAPAYRPFLVDTPHGAVRALGTRFSVRHLDRETCRVAVFQDKVEIRPLGGDARILRAGEQADFGTREVRQPVEVEASTALWEQGMLLARNMRLADVIAEMARHRPGVLRCDPAVADLRVSGAISLADTDAGLALLVRTLPLRIERNTRYWVTVAPRA
ncbi:FecR domain-containing protein [Thauera sinica]|uniref:FecR domain-containing protein n=1 Tax=Thauera sinica TaxID=2665146 RepID=A0ABW1AR56_9RHOO|nr:FecR domain-containing protein [Thauera sp. K11]ATE59654.1 iron dicitrate transport regulator FecR [Thauera sp. K11]